LIFAMRALAVMIQTVADVRTTTDYARGAVFGLAAVVIWAGNIVVAGLGLRSSLTPWDISAIRFGVAGLVLLPYLMRSGLGIDRLGWIGMAALVLGGAPTVLLVNTGLLFAPASHAGALFPGVMPLLVAVLAAAILKEAFTLQKRAGFMLIATGVVGIVSVSGGTIGTSQNIGHLLFLASAFAFACYTVAMRRAQLEGLHAAAISAVGSMLIYLPPYAIVAGASLFDAPPGAIALQALVQGLLTAVFSYVVYGLAVSILGASSGAAFAALCPAMTALMAIPVLGEWPSPADWGAIMLISVGVYVVSGGPVPRWRE
jgi:drug/metabolite transporter (DMT)-like permease